MNPSLDAVTSPEATLGAFLRAKRERLPAPSGGLRQRRTPGLRREEVAERAGVSVDWYVRLEQNRASCPSAAVLDSVSRALQLSATERRYLFRLAGRELEATGPDAAAITAAHASVLAVLQSVQPMWPAAVLGPRFDVLAANPVYDALHLGFGGHALFGRNLAWFLCCDPRAPQLFEAHDGLVGDVIAALRANHARHLASPAFAGLLDELHHHCPTFRAHWAEHRVREKTSGRKRFRHPQAGVLELEWHTVVARESVDQVLLVYRPLNVAGAGALRRLAESAGAPEATGR